MSATILQARHDAHGHGSGLTEAEQLETLRDPYTSSPKYAWITALVIGSIIAFFGLANLSYQLRRRYPGLFANSWYARKKTAAWRYLASKQQRLKNGRWFQFPVLGAGLIMLAFFLFMFVWTWSVRPYYYSKWYISSPPLAIRTGFMALGCFPFIFAFASKVNAVTFVTGVSHEKLQVYHQYLSHLFLFLSWVHTIPFLIQGLSEWKPDYEPPTKQLNYSMLVAKKPYYWTGVIMLVQLSVLCWGSLPYFRRKNYEFFKWFHVINAIAFIGFFFVHCNRLLGSWDYLYATVVVYGACVLVRFAYLFVRNGAGLPRAKFEVLDGGMVKLRLMVNGEEHWRPGQHYFLNFPSCQPLQSHPFTVASIPTPGPHPHTSKEMHLLIRQASGLTAKLVKALSKRESDTVPVLIDGPYGGVEGDLTLYEHVILIAGGTGITFVKPVLEWLLLQMQYTTTRTSTIEVVWSVRSADNLKWLQEDLEQLQYMAPKGCVKLTFHVTGAAGPSFDGDDEKKTTIANTGRADIKALISQGTEQNHALGVAACGPSELMYDVRNAVADEQVKIIRGQTNCKEVFLHTEEYSW